MADEVFLLLHGWGGNKPAHWQEHLALRLTEAGKTVRYPKMPEPGAPNLADWQARLGEEITSITSEYPNAQVTVLAHSLGCINWLHYVANTPIASPIAERVLLVAPPYVVPQLPPIDVPTTVTEFFPPPISPGIT